MGGDTGDNAGLTPSPGTVQSQSQNYFAVPRRGQLAGRAYITTPSHVRSPLAQTPSPPASEDDVTASRARSTLIASSPLLEETVDEPVVSNDDNSAQPALLPPPTTISPDTSAGAPPADRDGQAPEPLSWPDFLEQYAEGKWDPIRAPPMPYASGSIPRPARRKSFSEPSTSSAEQASRPTIVHKHASDMEAHRPSPPRPTGSGRTQSSPDSVTVEAPTIMQRRGAEQLLLSNFTPPTLANPTPPPLWTAAIPRTPSPTSLPPVSPHPITPSAVADAATVRWAGARVKVAPLSLSSPERELIDPLSDYVAGLPTPQQKAMAEYFSRSIPRKSLDRGTPNPALHTPPLASPMRETEPKLSQKLNALDNDAEIPLPALNSPAIPTPLAAKPLTSTPKVNSRSGYFFEAQTPTNEPPQALVETESSQTSELPTSESDTERSVSSSVSSSLPSSNLSSGDFCDMPSIGSSFSHERDQVAIGLAGPSTERRADAPPTPSSSAGSNPLNPRPVDKDIPKPALTKTREEALFEELQYFVPPHPPNELERRTALHKFNILHTSPDVNFDRIAHLAKLVFQAKWVLITLVDKDDQFLKHASGLPFNSGARDPSFCNHAILQDTEPLVVLNAKDDWRFANNPMVTTTADPSDPNYLKVAFYAGTPLRTADGFNVGSLCVIDDVPRTEFTPRQRHTLKEFGAIIMREMELWRDKVQLRIRDRIQTSMEQFTRECLELDGPASELESLSPEQNMRRVYSSAASLVKSTLDLEGAVVVDVSNFEVLHTSSGGSGSHITKTYHGDLFSSNMSASSPRNTDSDESGDVSGEKRHEFGRIPALPVLGSAENSSPAPERSEPLSGEAHAKLAAFLANFPDGRIYERIVPACFRGIVPTNLQYAMVVPIFNVDGQPFILLCGYTTDRTKHYLEGFEMQYLRAIGVIILSAVLKRRMKLADKAKSLFISNISHELRTPLHGILAAAELLADSGLTPNQQSYLQTVEACGTSLVETVNHVLDFSKLSGTTKSMSIKRTSTDLISLLEDTVEGSWVGARARAVYGTADIGSAYSPPNKVGSDPDTNAPRVETTVETVLDIGYREEGWILKCEKGGIRRVLMNLMGNSLKFTDRGFVHITLRELIPEPGSNKVRIELAVLDSGKGISKDFLKNQMFQPFSQENPLHTGTGLGLAIVNSIVKSEGIHGKVDVYSTEGVGTEIRVTIETEAPSRSSFTRDKDDVPPLTRRPLPSTRVFPVSFGESHRGQKLLRETLTSYMTEWWSVDVVNAPEYANVLLVNEDSGIVEDLTRQMDVSKAVILLASHRGSNELATILSAFEGIGGKCYVVYKPCRPSHLFKALQRAVSSFPGASPFSPSTASTSSSAQSRPLLAQKPSLFSSDELKKADGDGIINVPGSLLDGGEHGSSVRASSPSLGVVPRRYSEDFKAMPRRPALPRSKTHNASDSTSSTISLSGQDTPPSELRVQSATSSSKSPPVKSARVLIVEDNHVNRALLAQWLRKQGYPFEEAIDGQAAVDLFRERPSGHFDIVLVDMSMPVLDGVGAITQMRSIETQRYDKDLTADKDGASQPTGLSSLKRSKIFALSGLASNEDKVRAFNAGVDGYLVKPVSFKTLSTVFARLEDPST